MTYYFFPFTNEELMDSSNNGWDYLLKNKDRWIATASLQLAADEHTKGIDYIIHDNVCYFFDRTYTNIEENYYLVTGKPSKNAADIVTE